VNDNPQQEDEQAPDHRQGAEGHAFQVNDNPQHDAGLADEAP
jgi:hypothetical protein